MPHLAHPVDPEVLLPHAADLLTELAVTTGSRRTPTAVGVPGFAFVVRRRGDRQHCADRLDPVLIAVRVDEQLHSFGRRSSSAWAKYADALRRISFARRSSRFSRSSALSRSRSALVSPGRRPWSRSACRTHLRNVSLVQPIFSAIDPIAAHCEHVPTGAPAPCARLVPGPPGSTCSKNSSALSSQSIDSPANPARFKTTLASSRGSNSTTTGPSASARSVASTGASSGCLATTPSWRGGPT